MINLIAAGVVAWIVATSLSIVNRQAVGWPLGCGLIVGTILWSISEGYFAGPDLVALPRLRIKRSHKTAQAAQIHEMPELSQLVEPEPVLLLEAPRQAGTNDEDSRQPLVAYPQFVMPLADSEALLATNAAQ